MQNTGERKIYFVNTKLQNDNEIKPDQNGGGLAFCVNNRTQNETINLRDSQK